MDPDLTVVLLGHSGVGKSASGNNILGRTAFESRKAFISVTKQISQQTGRVFGKNISVIDTPAILDSEQEVRTLCENIMCSSRRKLFLVVVKIDRFTKEQQDAVEAAIRTIEDDGMKNSLMLFTNGDTLETMSMSLDGFLNEDPNSPLPELVQRFAGFHVFNNENGGKEQVKELLEKSGLLLNVVRPRGNTEERRIVLLGVPGAGKSSSGNTILGSNQFKSGCGFNPVTTETVSKSAIVEGRWVTVVDTPGFTNEVLTPEQLFMEIMKSTVVASPGPHAFVIVVSLSRISEAEAKLFEMLQVMFGSDASKYVMVLFTHGDELGGQSIDELIRSNDRVSKLVNMCGGRFCVMDNTKRGNRQQVRNFLSKIDEMVAANGGKHYTDDMFRLAETFIQEEKNRLGRVKAAGAATNTQTKEIQDTVWQRLKRFVIERWNRVCTFFNRLYEEIRSVLTPCRSSAGSRSESKGSTLSLVTWDSLDSHSDSTEKDHLIKKHK